MQKSDLKEKTKVTAPQNAVEMMSVLSTLMAAVINDEIDSDKAKLTANIANRIVDVWNADTRTKEVAIKYGLSIKAANQWQVIESEPKEKI